MSTEDKAKKASWKLVGDNAEYTGVNDVKGTFDISSVTTPEITRQLMYYGVKQKLADSIAGIGKGASDNDKIAEMEDTFDRLVRGQWNKTVATSKRVTKTEFMAKAEEEGYKAEEASKLWDMLHSK